MPTTPQFAGALALPTALGTAMVVLAFYVAFELCHRVRQLGAGERNAWLMAAALALSCGVASAQILNLNALLGPFEVGFHPGLLIGGVVIVLLLSLVAMNWAFVDDVGWTRLLAGAGTLGLAASAGQVLLLSAVGLSANPDWHPLGLGLSWFVSTVGFAWALLLFMPLRDAVSVRLRPRQVAAATIAGMAVLMGQSLSVAAARMPQWDAIVDPALLASETVAAVASFGVTQLLLLMLLACVVESRMRGKLDKARTALQGRRPARRDHRPAQPHQLRRPLAQAQTAGRCRTGPGGAAGDRAGRLQAHQRKRRPCAGDRVLQRMAQRLRGLGPAALGGTPGQRRIPAAGCTANDAAATGPGAGHGRCSIRSPSPASSRRPRDSTVDLLDRHGAVPAAWRDVGADQRTPAWPCVPPRPQGGATYSLFDPRMVVDMREQAELLRDLRLALSALAARAVLPAEDPCAQRRRSPASRRCCAGTTRSAA